MKKKTILERWHCEEFVESVRPFIEAISAGHAVIRDADFAGLEVGPFAVIKELERSSLYGSHLENVNLSYANIHNLSNSILSRVNFSKATLERCSMFS
ncbi:pentapeptide repeat-containing protein [Paenibacillus sp. MZ04-78.2]|uniref:pentapeptide repeat-containing protein n=1 Tax=Paenibacillus sp. MZ04-78.2 TaxID=2962034 RepID=UPI0020B8DF48|nr:pentapeptide repeat-containing protein [Paenibacillus sp. MZ04-78.2]MCP3773846.1 pentapeptide repeat-containing protein [Paenibacillus sp. MZ04-78.2]